MSEFLYSLVNMSIAGSFIAVVIMLLRIPLKKAPRKYSYMLWSILGIRLLCPFSFSSAVSLFNLFRTETAGGQMSFEAAPVLTAPVDIPTAPIVSDIPAAAPTAPQAVSGALDSLPYILFAVWAAGVLAFAIYNIAALARLKKCISCAVNIGGNIYECPAISNAFVLGIIRPKIYIPTGLSDKERDFIISHERTHIRRFDCVIKPVALIALGLHWFNPLMWLSFFLMVRDMEISCDERAVRGYDAQARREYASALLNMSVRQNHLSSGGILAFGESSIKQRIKNVLSLKKPTLWITIVAAAVIIIAAVCLLTNANASKPEPDSTSQPPAVTEETSIPSTESTTPEITEPESQPAVTEPVTVTVPEPEIAPELTPENAKKTVNDLLSSFVLVNDSGEIIAIFTMPEQIPADPEGKTKLTISLGADYSLGGGTFENKRFLDGETGLKSGRSYRSVIGNENDPERHLQSVMLRAAFMTEIDENTFKEYYVDYITMSKPLEFGNSANVPAKVDITSSGNEYTLEYRLAYDNFGAKLTLPDGMTASLSNSDGSELYSPGIPTIVLNKNGADVGTIHAYSFGTYDREVLESIDPASDELPMPIYSPVALSNMVDYHSSYFVVKNSGTGSIAVCSPVMNGEITAQCIMTYDYAVSPYFLMISLNPGTLSDADLRKLAESLSFVG